MKFVPTFHESENLSLASWKRVRAIIHFRVDVPRRVISFFNINFGDNIDIRLFRVRLDFIQKKIRELRPRAKSS